MKRTIERTLHTWKTQKQRKPLLLRGARQVGKSYLIRHFGKKEFDKYLEVNLELYPEIHNFFQTQKPNEIIKNLTIFFNTPIDKDTLVFLDEIQECPSAISSLRYFYELTPEIPIISAGSLVDFVLDSSKVQVPVGRIQYLFLYPLNFIEYLEALGEIQVINLLESIKIKDTIPLAIHQKLLKLYKDYIYVGGMPEVISHYIENKNFPEVKRSQISLLQTYRDDFGKYANLPRHKYLQKVLSKAPALISKNLKYSAIDKETPSRDIKDALDMLVQAGIIQKIKAVTNPNLPLHYYSKDNHLKIAFLDVGLVVRSMFLEYTSIDLPNSLNVYSGVLTEQFVIQELTSYHSPFEKQEFFYWKRDKKGSSSEIDLLYVLDSEVFPIEIKSGKTGTLKSLQIYKKEYNPKLCIRYSENPLSYYDNILSIPLYMISQTNRLIREL
jgi:hypothetical protein